MAVGCLLLFVVGAIGFLIAGPVGAGVAIVALLLLIVLALTDDNV